MRDDPITLFEIQGLVLKLSKPEVPSPIADVILDFKPFFEKVIQVVRQKQESSIRFQLRAKIPCEHKSLIYES